MHRILVVDDEYLVADTLGLIFRKHGFDVRVAYSARSALDSARSFSPELLLCDITMPGGDGVDLIAAMHREMPACEVLVLTGYHANVIRVREECARLQRELHLLTKPCPPAELLQQAGQILAQVHQAAQILARA